MYPERQLPALSSAQTSGAAVLIEAGPTTRTEPACDPVQATLAPLHGILILADLQVVGGSGDGSQMTVEVGGDLTLE
eukprot:SAG22_NODE_2739_length_2261_cov_1.708603_3_plen_76_part_01